MITSTTSDRPRVLIFIVSYHAEAFIQQVLQRIPQEVWANDDYEAHVLIIDDQSADETFSKAIKYADLYPDYPITVLYNPINQGYGGNQKIGYYYAIEQGYDAVVLLHGDGQYAPEYLDQMIRPILGDEADVVLGSRMLNKSDALKGRMPMYKWLGNQVLTFLQNHLLGTSLAEFHTGYRAYRVEALKAVPYAFNADYFDFDTDILIQMVDTGQRFKEIPIPTYYGDEISYVNGIKYGWLILRSTLQSRLVPRGIFYTPKFDYNEQNEHYTLKLGYASSHQFALDQVKPGMKVLDIGSGPGLMAEQLAQQGASVISLDQHIQPLAKKHSTRTIEANAQTYEWTTEDTDVDQVLLLDIIEHLRYPEEFLMRLRRRCPADHRPTIVITTANVAFFPVRLGLLLGWFRYGKRGILDKDHHRLFTFGSMRQILRQTGYDIVEVKGIPAPFPLALGNNALARFLLLINRGLNRIARSIFAYQIAVVARPRPTLNHLLAQAQQAGASKLLDLQNQPRLPSAQEASLP